MHTPDKKLACDIIDTAATHVSLVHDVTALCFRNFQVLVFNKPDHKLTEKLHLVYYFLNSISIDGACDASLLGVPCKKFFLYIF